MKITKKMVEQWLATNRPELALHVEPNLVNGKGFYRRDAGPAASFKGFSTWQAVAIELEMIEGE